MNKKKALLLSNKGLENFAVTEICTILKKSQEELEQELPDGAVRFSYDSFEELFTLCYLSQSASKIMIEIGSFEHKDSEDLLLQIETLDFSKWLTPERSLAVRADYEYDDFSRRDIEAEVGGIIIKNTKCSVNLNSPQVQIFVTKRGSTIFVGVDLSGVELAKRDYRIFTGRVNIKAPVAALACHVAQIKEGEVVIDPFCKNGTVAIECAHQLLGRSVHYFTKDKFLFTTMPEFVDIDFEGFLEEVDTRQKEKNPCELYAIDDNFRHISAIKKNAKIAGIDKQIQYSRTAPDWIDTKFDKEQVHHIISFVPQFAKTFSEKIIEKQLIELFYQASFVLNPKGNVVCISRETTKLTEIAAKYNFKKTAEQKVQQGDMSFYVVRYEKTTSE